MNERIKELRIKIGLSQLEFAERLEMSENYVYRLEKGHRVPSDRCISSICREFNVNEDWLRTGTGEMFSAVVSDPEAELLANVNPIIRALVLSYKRLDPAHQQIVDQYLDAAIAEYQKRTEDSATTAAGLVERAQQGAPAEEAE